jgi:hypothetical protein
MTSALRRFCGLALTAMLAIVVTGCASPSPTGPAATEVAAPRFAAGGPDADDYGARDGYPVGGRFGSAFAAMAQRRSEGFVVVDDPVLRSHGGAIAELAAKRRLPSVVEREYAEDGGLLAYAVNRPEVWRWAAILIDRILKGMKPGDLPVEQPTKYDLVVNMRTAKLLGLTIPPSLLLRAGQVIE